MRPKGYMIDVPVTLTVAVRGGNRLQCKRAARMFFHEVLQQLAVNGPDKDIIPGVKVTEFSLELSGKPCEVTEALQADDFGPASLVMVPTPARRPARDNPDCNGAGPHLPGEVRLMPSGGDGNLILCRTCWERELRYRRERNTEERVTLFQLPSWEFAKVYNPGK